MSTHPVVLTGPPGSGKSALGPSVAARLGYTWIDLDREVERLAGSTPAEIFARGGEPEFRGLEAQVFARHLGAPSTVISCGGGTLVPRATRRLALTRSVVIALKCAPEVLFARLASGPRRPLVGSPEALDALMEARSEAYAEAHLTLDTGALSMDECSERIAKVLSERPMVMPLGSKTYVIRFAPLSELTEAALGFHGVKLSAPYLVLTDEEVKNPWAQGVSESFGAEIHALPSGEGSKSIERLSGLWDDCAARGLTRRSALLCVGGGVVTDLGGMAAATWLRGIGFVSAPTSLLAMADASVGGKTAVNHPLGKNLLGVFHHPSLVHIDTDTLETLPTREFRSGMAEIVKIALARDASLFELIEAHSTELRAYGSAALTDILRAAIQAKINVVADDPFEDGARAVLNLGHTLGHALEASSGYALRHGECVAIGTVGALRLGERMGLTPRALSARVIELFKSLGLPVTAGVSRVHAQAAIAHDKKREREGLRMIFVPELGRSVIARVDLATARGALDAVLTS